MFFQISFETIPLFVLIFYVLLPVLIFFLYGVFWARIYSIISSFLGALFAFYYPQKFLETLIPETVPEQIAGYFKTILFAIADYGLYVFAAVVFFILLLLQHGIIKLLSFFGWIGTEE